MFKRVVLFDLDRTLIDSDHRTPSRADGTLDLESYRRNKTFESVFADTLLPLFRVNQQLDMQRNFIAIVTARLMDYSDFAYLHAHNFKFHSILSRDDDESHMCDGKMKVQKIAKLIADNNLGNLPIYMFDDAKVVISETRRAGIKTLNALKINKRMKQ